MEPVILKVRSPDPTFLDYYQRLAHGLGADGTVYTPVPLIPPNARVAVPPPTEVLVAFTSHDCFHTVCDAARSYLESGQDRRLSFESRHGAVSADRQNLPEPSTLLHELVDADEETPHGQEEDA